MGRHTLSILFITITIGVFFGIVSAETEWKYTTDPQFSEVLNDEKIELTGDIFCKYLETGDDIARIVVSNGVIYTTDNRKINALDEITGNNLWKYQSENTVLTPIINDRLNSFVCDKNVLNALNLTTGIKKLGVSG